MNIWTLMVNALKGGDDTNSTGDVKALNILDKEIRRAADELNDSKAVLAELMANAKSAEVDVNRTQKDIADHENYAKQALDKNNETLALEIAEKIVELETTLEHKQEIQAGFDPSIHRIQRIIHQAEQNLKRLKQQFSTIKATESMHRAQAIIADRYSDRKSEHPTAKQYLQQIQQKQSETDAQLETKLDNPDQSRKDALINKLEEAGIVTETTRADEILARIKSKP